MERITEKMLQARVDYLNKIKGFTPETVKYNTIGAFILDYAYGGVSLEQVLTDGGGVSDVFNAGHVPKRELWSRLNAFIAGITGNY